MLRWPISGVLSLKCPRAPTKKIRVPGSPRKGTNVPPKRKFAYIKENFGTSRDSMNYEVTVHEYTISAG
jgi:hypothetical protein